MTIVATYDYVDERGELLFQVCRTDDKRFVQRISDGNGGFRWGIGETRRVLFRLPRVLEHIAENRRETLYIVEGEKDVLAIEAVGGVATCNPMGAGKWNDAYSELLMGARRVVVVADRDAPGLEHAHAVAASLASVGVDAEIMEARVGKDTADHLAAGHTLEELLPFEADIPFGEATVERRVVTLEEFAAVDEPGTEPLIGEPDNVLIGEGTDAMVYGDGGAGKTTLTVDLACHLAAGDDWLGLTVARPLRVLLIENEGPRSLFRAKLRRKLEGWQGSPLEGRVLVWEMPWASFTFADGAQRESLADVARGNEIDVVVVGPVTASGMQEAGTLQDVRAFAALLEEIRAASGRRLAFVLVHHENKGGKVSGAWEGCGDTLLHVQGQGHGRTRVYVQKARWASKQHGTTLQLLWADGDGFALEDKPEVDDDAVADAMRDYVRENGGTGWGKVRASIKGVENDRIDAVRAGLFASRELVNVQKIDGDEVATYDVQPRKPARLFLADDVAVAHLCRDPGTAPAQTVPLWEAGQ